jgi:hypothetical protein
MALDVCACAMTDCAIEKNVGHLVAVLRMFSSEEVVLH